MIARSGSTLYIVAMMLYTLYTLYILVIGPRKSSHICLSAENADFGSQKCNNLGLKGAIHYKVGHVVTKYHIFSP